MKRNASATWKGDLKQGAEVLMPKVALFPPCHFLLRRGLKPKGTNPEELIAAALASCYSMAPECRAFRRWAKSRRDNNRCNAFT